MLFDIRVNNYNLNSTLHGLNLKKVFNVSEQREIKIVFLGSLELWTSYVGKLSVTSYLC